MDGADRAGTLTLEVGLLGPIEVEREGEAVGLGGQKPRALLAMLALDPGRVVSVDALVEALWPGDPPETAGHAVQVYVSQLRKAIGSDRLLTRAPGYVLDLEPERVDVHRFARLAREGRAALEGGDAAAAEVALREALALWRGAALADFLYEPFAQAQIARLEELRTVVVEERIDADLALGRHAELVSELEALVQAERLRERPRRQLMLALYRSGRQADALAAYRDARETLVEELGIDPGPELRELEAAILRQDDSLLLEETPLAAPVMQFRRLVTILFVDVVESMSLAEELDPEALSGVLRRYFETVSAAVTRHGGTVEKYAGDAVMAAFGTPVSHEDDALRAARAALDIRVGLAALNEQLRSEHGVALEIRIGIEGGEVVTSATDVRQRLVTGEAVGIASKLEASAGADEIVVGEAASRFIDHAARLEPLGALAIKGRSAPVHAFRLLELTPAAPAFESRTDAPLVGRSRELAALRRSLKRARDGGSAQVALVIGSPGVGTSRRAGGLARRPKDVTALWGRCLSYGDGITYWPLREVVAQAPAGDERDAVLAALEAETPPPAPEIAFLFRQFCEALARERPLVLVFDDVHWAEPTFLELVEHLADKGQAPILVVCVAREELLEERADFLAGRANAAQVLLDPLSADETDALLDGLGGTVLESDQRSRIVATAEGNPFFLEQLLALALEGGLVERALPETVQALLAARLDRLGPGERAVLERGAVIGKEFAADDVVALLEAAAAPTADAHLRSLADRGFVRPRGDSLFVFRHVLVQEAVYRSAPKRLRAELHERYADRLDETSPELAELDEFVGYHLEQAYRLRTELGEGDRRVERLAEDGGRRLGDAGVRAWKRGDVHATTNLLGRATSLLPSEDEWRLELLCELGIALGTAGEAERAERMLNEAVRTTSAIGNRRIELRVQIEAAYLRTLTEPEGTADELLDIASRAIPELEVFGDDRSLGRTWMYVGWVHGGVRCQYRAGEEAAVRALAHYTRGGWPIATPIGEIATALYFGPTPVPEAIARCDQLLSETEGRDAGAAIFAYLGGLEAQRGRFERARELVGSAKATFDDLGLFRATLNTCAALLADIEVLAGNEGAAEDVLRDLCSSLVQIGDWNHLSSRAADLADVMCTQRRYDEAEHWTRVASLRSASDDLATQIRLRSALARISAGRGDARKAEELGRLAVRLAEETDALNLRARALMALAEAAQRSDRNDASTFVAEAGRLYEKKGNTVAAARISEFLSAATPA